MIMIFVILFSSTSGANDSAMRYTRALTFRVVSDINKGLHICVIYIGVLTECAICNCTIIAYMMKLDEGFAFEMSWFVTVPFLKAFPWQFFTLSVQRRRFCDSKFCRKKRLKTRLLSSWFRFSVATLTKQCSLIDTERDVLHDLQKICGYVTIFWLW